MNFRHLRYNIIMRITNELTKTRFGTWQTSFVNEGERRQMVNNAFPLLGY